MILKFVVSIYLISFNWLLQLLNPCHGCFLWILSTCSRAFVQELKIQPQPVYGSPAGHFGLQPGLFYCLRQIGGFVCSVSLHTCAASRFHTSICLLHHPRSTRRRLAMLDPGPQPIPQAPFIAAGFSRFTMGIVYNLSVVELKYI